ncbi:hypothetical protein SNEBB_010100 [Seison nebaliae]|nr:hypothetical protein SNEBB_010100 [Seison nebaliae]
MSLECGQARLIRMVPQKPFDDHRRPTTIVSTSLNSNDYLKNSCKSSICPSTTNNHSPTVSTSKIFKMNTVSSGGCEKNNIRYGRYSNDYQYSPKYQNHVSDESFEEKRSLNVSNVEDKKKSHNQVERNRREKINAYIFDLSRLVPQLDGKAISKGTILESVYKYIKTLQETNHKLQNENIRLRHIIDSKQNNSYEYHPKRYSSYSNDTTRHPYNSAIYRRPYMSRKDYLYENSIEVINSDPLSTMRRNEEKDNSDVRQNSPIDHLNHPSSNMKKRKMENNSRESSPFIRSSSMNIGENDSTSSSSEPNPDHSN